MLQLDNRRWVTEQYRTPGNLRARMALHERFSTNPTPWHKWVFDQIHAPADAQILEIGCGPGALWTANRDHIPAGWRVLLTDLSPGMVQQAADALAGTPNLRFSLTDAQTLPFPDAQFDVVIANHMLYHVPDRARALAEFKRVLRPEGRLYVATNGKNHMAKIRELALRFAPTAATQIGMHERFVFEQATDELGRFFGDVRLHAYENRLVVTDAHALADYMLSGTPVLVAESEQARLRHWLQQEMSKTGAIEIVNETGLFEATVSASAPAAAPPASAPSADTPPAAPRRSAKRRTARSRKHPPSEDE